MNVRLVLTLSLFGLLVGLGSITGLVPSGWETALWGVIGLIYAGVLARQAPGKFFLHGFVTGFIAGAISILCQALFLNQYVAHNAKAADVFKSLPPGMPPAVFLVLAAPIWAAVFGASTGLVTWLWARFTRPKPAAPAA